MMLGDILSRIAWIVLLPFAVMSLYCRLRPKPLPIPTWVNVLMASMWLVACAGEILNHKYLPATIDGVLGVLFFVTLIFPAPRRSRR